MEKTEIIRYLNNLFLCIEVGQQSHKKILNIKPNVSK